MAYNRYSHEYEQQDLDDDILNLLKPEHHIFEQAVIKDGFVMKETFDEYLKKDGMYLGCCKDLTIKLSDKDNHV